MTTNTIAAVRGAARANADSSSAHWTDVCAIDDVRPSAGVAALVGGRQVAVFRIAGAVYALANRDPFSGAEVLSRGLLGERDGTVYVASPLHKQRFELATGRCLDDPMVSVDQVSVRVCGGRVLVGGSSEVPPASTIAVGGPIT